MFNEEMSRKMIKYTKFQYTKKISGMADILKKFKY
jgi:hypothetical protein